MSQPNETKPEIINDIIDTRPKIANDRNVPPKEVSNEFIKDIVDQVKRVMADEEVKPAANTVPPTTQELVPTDAAASVIEGAAELKPDVVPTEIDPEILRTQKQEQINELEDKLKTLTNDDEKTQTTAEIAELKLALAEMKGGRRRSTRRRQKKSGKKSRRQSKKGGKKHRKRTSKKGGKSKKRSHRKH